MRIQKILTFYAPPPPTASHYIRTFKFLIYTVYCTHERIIEFKRPHVIPRNVYPPLHRCRVVLYHVDKTLLRDLALYMHMELIGGA